MKPSPKNRRSKQSMVFFLILFLFYYFFFFNKEKEISACNEMKATMQASSQSRSSNEASMHSIYIIKSFTQQFEF
jgi:hypothetical protein